MFARDTRRVVSALGAAIAVSTLASSAVADRLQGTRFESRELAHTVDMRVDRGLAVLVVRRTVMNTGDRSDQSTFWIDVPNGGVATRLRSLGMRGGEHVWFEGELMEAEAAAQKYKELTGIGGYYPKDPALLSWRRQSELALQVFPVPAGGLKTVEYTIKLPASYREGRYQVELPKIGTDALAAELTIEPARQGDELRVHGRPEIPGAKVKLDQPVKIELVPRGMPRVGGGLASLKISRGRVFLHAHVEAAPKLSAVPKGAHVVVLIDTSRSVDEQDVNASIAASKAYLSHFKDAKVEVITFDRKPHRTFGGFMPVAQARARLDSLHPTQGNGSHVDAALADAYAALGQVAAGTPTRIVIMSDLRMRSRLTPAMVKPIAARGNAVLHIAKLSQGAEVLSRDDESEWAPVARATGGLAWSAESTDDAANTAARLRVYEELARPLRIDRFKVEAKELADNALAPPETLLEGEGFESLQIAPAEVTALEVTGELWSRSIRLPIAVDPGETRNWSALAFGSEILSELDEKEMMVLAKRGAAVSPVTSYLAIEPGVRPSTEGLDDGERFGTIGHGSGTGSGQGFGSGHGRLGSRVDPQEWLKREIAEGWNKCGGTGHATVTLETTSQEVVDVPSVVLAPAADAKLQSCLTEVVWALDLPGGFNALIQEWTVEI